VAAQHSTATLCHVTRIWNDLSSQLQMICSLAELSCDAWGLVHHRDATAVCVRLPAGTSTVLTCSHALNIKSCRGNVSSSIRKVVIGFQRQKHGNNWRYL
jgi:hypothetical protein